MQSLKVSFRAAALPGHGQVRGVKLLGLLKLLHLSGTKLSTRLKGYLAHNKAPPPRTLHLGYA
jgi:hypothetical protein